MPPPTTERTLRFGAAMSANDPKRTSTARDPFRSARLGRYGDRFKPGDPVTRQREFVTLAAAGALGWPFAASGEAAGHRIRRTQFNYVRQSSLGRAREQ